LAAYAVLLTAPLGVSVPAIADGPIGVSKTSLKFVDSLQKILREPSGDSAKPGKFRFPPLAENCDLFAVRNEFEFFQIVISNNGRVPFDNVTVSVLPTVTHVDAPTCDLFWEHYVFVSNPSGNATDVPMWYPDALIPLRVQPRRTVGAGDTEVVWVSAHVPELATPGDYPFQVLVTNGSGGRVATGRIYIHVQNAAIPVTRHFKATGALYYEIVRDYYNKHYRKGQPLYQRDDPEWIAIRKTMYEFMLEYRFTPYDLPVSQASSEAEEYRSDPRVNCFRLPWIGEDDGHFRETVSALARHSALPGAYYYQSDEPAVPQFPSVLQLADRLRSVNPNIRHLVTIEPVLPLAGGVDIWCPSIGSRLTNGSMNFHRLRLRRKQGEETWWYTMTVPRYPYPTWLIDDDAISHRIFFWMSSLYGFTGCVYSMVHGWSDDPYSYVQSFLGSNGDGLLIYPGEPLGSKEPFPSIRLMTIRDGLEDYELLSQLSPQERETACRALVQDLTRWSRPPEALEGIRRRAVDRIGGKRRGLEATNYQQPDWTSPQVVVNVPAASQPPQVDGVMSAGEWDDTARLYPLLKSNGLAPAKAQTRARITRGKDSLHVAARCELPTEETAEPLKQQWFALAVDPGRRKNRYFFFVVTAKGSSHTELRSENGIDPTWGVPWSRKARFAGDHFVVEMEIPFSSLGRRPGRGEVWGFNLLRRSLDDFSSYQADYGDVTLMPGLRFK